MIECKLFQGKPLAEKLRSLEELRKHTDKIIWIDNRDSAGNTEFEVLPLVDAYWKGQLYSDLEVYNRELICNRLHSDFFVRHYGIDDLPFTPGVPLPASPEERHKIELGWNVGFGNYLNLGSVEEMLKLYILKTLQIPKFVDACSPRDIDVHCRFRGGGEPVYQRHRADMRQRISDMPIESTNETPVPRKQFVQEMRRAKIVVSPFGWGEICYRDFEAVLNGACLVKPSVSHLSTWPNIFHEHESYVPVRWDLADLSDTIRELLDDSERRLQIAQSAQTTLQEVYSERGLANFTNLQSDRLTALIHKTTTDRSILPR